MHEMQILQLQKHSGVSGVYGGDGRAHNFR